jgi:tRNA dimethylallyltransferase
MSRPDVIALFGPTAVGKTAVAIALAQTLRDQGESPVAVSADALQVYAGLEILTGAATAAERCELEHRLISILPVNAHFSAGQYAELAHNEIDALLKAGRLPIVVGGTGLYLRAALADLSLRPPPVAGARERWSDQLDRAGPEALHVLLTARAPATAARIAPTDSQRIVRALELHDGGQLEPPIEKSELWTHTTRHPTLLIGLVTDRDRLYRQIDARVEAMLADGVEDEVRRACAVGAGATARKALGFEELLTGDIEGMKRRTRNYARRQLTWMRKLPGVRQVEVGDREPAEVAAEIARYWLR